MSMKLDDYKTEGGNKKEYPRVEDGTYPARVVQLINLGRQVKTDWKTGEVETYDDGNPIVQPKVWVTFELPTETIDYGGEESPRWYSKEYTISAHEKAALPVLLAACGVDSGDITDLLDKPLLVTIGSTVSGKAKITQTSKLMKGMEVPDIFKKEKMVVFDPYQPDMDVWETLPRFLREKIESAVDYDKMRFPASDKKETADKKEEPDYEDDTIPF